MAVETKDPRLALERTVTRRLRNDDSQRRVAAVLAEVASAAIHPAHRDGWGSESLGGMLEDPVASATRVAVETLIDEIEDLVDSLPRSTLDRLMTEQLIADLGLE